ncbi:hypothetical protein OF83DRAFT_195533 [Amylostereum chailletii]|nr:hypothetical protein OF83DRAFT_195533 [Amylostereum chailletii]
MRAPVPRSEMNTRLSLFQCIIIVHLSTDRQRAERTRNQALSASHSHPIPSRTHPRSGPASPVHPNSPRPRPQCGRYSGVGCPLPTELSLLSPSIHSRLAPAPPNTYLVPFRPSRSVCIVHVPVADMYVRRIHPSRVKAGEKDALQTS